MQFSRRRIVYIPPHYAQNVIETLAITNRTTMRILKVISDTFKNGATKYLCSGNASTHAHTHRLIISQVYASFTFQKRCNPMWWKLNSKLNLKSPRIETALRAKWWRNMTMNRPPACVPECFRWAVIFSLGTTRLCLPFEWILTL
jgi:hypothetical protein